MSDLNFVAAKSPVEKGMQAKRKSHSHLMWMLICE